MPDMLYWEGAEDYTIAKGRCIEYIVLHYTATVSSKPGTARNVCRWWDKDGKQASADFVVDNSTIVQYTPSIEDCYCWHCGGRKLATGGGRLYRTVTNRNSIGIELCSYRTDNNTGATAEAPGWLFTEQVLANAAGLVRWLQRKYTIPSDRVVTHFDVTGKLCPRPWLGYSEHGNWDILPGTLSNIVDNDITGVLT